MFNSLLVQDIFMKTQQVSLKANIIKRIPVQGFSFTEDITVQIKEDGIVTHCNHAGATVGVFVQDFYYQGKDHEVAQTAILCDKCDAWCDEDGEWYE